MDRRKLVIVLLLVAAILSGKSRYGSTTPSPSPAAEEIRSEAGPAYVGLAFSGEPAARVVALAPGYPAWRSGVRCGDVVLFAQTATGERVPLPDLSKYAGPGAPVKLTIARETGGAWHIEEHLMLPAAHPPRELARCAGESTAGRR